MRKGLAILVSWDSPRQASGGGDVPHGRPTGPSKERKKPKSYADAGQSQYDRLKDQGFGNPLQGTRDSIEKSLLSPGEN